MLACYGFIRSLPITLILLNLLSSIALLVWGSKLVQQGFTKTLGIKIKRFIQKTTRSRFSALLSGLGVTMLLQSSTATSLLAVSIAKQKIIRTGTALAVILGADVGTTLVVQILTFDLSWLSGLLLIGGVAGYVAAREKSVQQFLSQSVIGIGLILLSLAMIKEIAAPAADTVWMSEAVTYISGEPLFLLLCAALFTWVIHSSVAAVLLAASLTAAGALDLQTALYVVLGANLGGSFIAFIATLGDGALARQITSSNVLVRAAGVILFFFAIPEITNAFTQGVFSDDRALVMFHTGFNTVLCLLFLPFVGQVTALSGLVFHDRHAHKDENRTPKYLDGGALDTPSLALTHAARETARIAEMAETMLARSMQTFEGQDHAIIDAIKKTDHDVDDLNEAIKLYVTRLSEKPLEKDLAQRSIEILTFATNIENIGDVIDKSLMNLAKKRISHHLEFSKDGYEEIKSFHGLVLENLKLAQAAFVSKDKALAKQLIDQKSLVTEEAKRTLRKHFDRLKDGVKESFASSGVHLDVIRDLQRINSYATRIAFVLLDQDPDENGISS